ncbi:DUF4747 family protein [Paracoccus sp. MC1862]|uniref:DUF4747 family protein n=1 Tax=Paracoccus sp. MC1862 TaxID=2760307 RepID=UPI0016013986|nr:DUF4747 family protein [Paracoccus sp. MC1862]MBB1499424.1 DUF4747 family protein [Paracoccus sp. MC1862]QQO45381.1 DUF4747 family protein [Paracoccus sp. MC1862]
MAKNIDYAILNLVGHPHPPGTYKKYFDMASNVEGTRFFGDLSAGTSPVAERDGLLLGRLAFWTDIDPKEPVLQKANKERISQRDANIGLPRGIGFNPRVFNFAFNIKKHTLYVELRNDEGKTTSAGMVERAMKAITSALPETGIEYEVQLKPSKDALRAVLGIKQLNRIEIDFRIPNPDDLSQEEREILQEMDDLNARRKNVELYRDRDEESLTLTPRYETLASMAKDNGYVKAEGKTREGLREARSTKQHPAVVSRTFEGAGDDSSYGALISVAAE